MPAPWPPPPYPCPMSDLLPPPLPLPPLPVRAPALAELAPQVIEGIRAQRLPFPTHHGEARRPVERGEVPHLESPRLALLEPQPHDANAVLHLVVQGDPIAVQVDRRRQRLECLPRGDGDGLVHVECNSRFDEVLPGRHAVELPPEPRGNLLGRGLCQPAAGAAPVKPEPLERPANPRLIGVWRVAREQGIDEGGPGCARELLRERVRQGLRVPLEEEPRVFHGPDHHEPFPPSLPLECDRGRSAPAVSPAWGSLSGRLSSSCRYTDAVPSATSSIAFTSTPRPSAQESTDSWNRWRARP